ncbi:MAG TPA: serine protease [Streptosporangiaceae bacterium]
MAKFSAEPDRPATAQTPWQIRLSDPETGRVLGAGFRVAPRLALTCWHVVAEHRDRGTEVALTGPAGWSGILSPSDLEEAAPGADVALVRLPASVPDAAAAPMGPAQPPAPGRALASFGFRDQDDPGTWTRVVVEKLDPGAHRVWLAGHALPSGPMGQGFSGGPVADPGTGLIVGMASLAWAQQPAALMIPVAALAAGRAELRPLLLPGGPAGPEAAPSGDTRRSRVSPGAG